MSTNYFSQFKSEDHLSVGRGRRVLHSLTNYFQTIDRSSFRAGNIAQRGTEGAGNVAQTLGGVSGVLTLVGVETAAAVGLGVAFAGPQAAIAATVITVALLVRGAYSNRDSAHKALSKYVWSFVDNENPSNGAAFLNASALEDAVDAATTLLDDGKNQLKLIGSKLQEKQAAFTAFQTEVDRKVQMIELMLVDLNRIAQTQATRVSRTLTPNEFAMQTRINSDLRRQVNELKTLWSKAEDKGGAIFEYIRRCSHTANYLQAPHIVALGLKEKLSPGSVIGQLQPDFFTGSTVAINARTSFYQLSSQYARINAIASTL